ncbi:hypothetical protein PC9H_001525 [Pleurotus ostreatus]|uniref:Uncharacterized protein n=1 Tax=Pleurotus ostreatus TaxID=5322 RepID=A0A8H7A728_PLEOS|nr:uncharacterized protein PC9H_001525 [Pleurotus ostreatus]KAF7441176.1 hypothetical protein PC9H_001525 [Pleurotus ostreatus]
MATKSCDDEFATILNDITFTQNNGGTPGATILNTNPYPVQSYPSWFPGTHYASFAREWKWAINKLFDVPYEKVKKQIVTGGTAEPSFLRTHIEAVSGSGKVLTNEDIQDLKGFAGVLFAGGADAKKGQEELDRVIGHGRLPTFEVIHPQLKSNDNP